MKKELIMITKQTINNVIIAVSTLCTLSFCTFSYAAEDKNKTHSVDNKKTHSVNQDQKSHPAKDTKSNSDDDYWTGFYVGVDGGFSFNHAQLKSQHLGFTNPSDTTNTNTSFTTFSPGVKFGYTHQFSDFFAAGAEASVSFFNTHQKETLSYHSNINTNVYDRFTFSNKMQTSVKGRVGHVLDWNETNILSYLTTGASFSNVELTYENEGGDHYSNRAIKAGFLIGAGIEWGFRQDWSLRTEYFYVNYGDTINLKLPTIYGLHDPNGGARVDLSSHNVTAALNYWLPL